MMMSGRGRMRGRSRRRCVQDVIEDLRMTTADTIQFAQNREFFRTAVMGAKFRKGQAT
uniref:Uncharacterized protein n=1 Tax=Arion vulgaris TaxID=1028688 RepID=A0A0B7BTI3_9EUPU